MTLAEVSFVHLGLSPFFKDQVTDTELAAKTLARVIETQKDMVRIATVRDGGVAEWWAAPAGRLRHAAITTDEMPVIGDWVLAKTGGDHDRAVINHVLRRRSQLSRVAPGSSGEVQVLAANVDQVLIVSSLNMDLNLRRLERYLMMAWDGGAIPIVVLTKKDLLPPQGVQACLDQVATVARGVAVVAVSAVAEGGMTELVGLVRPGETLALVGSSGVGKSSLLNALAASQIQPTQTVRASDDRGRHTTTSRSLFRLPSGLLVIDTPGIRELAPLGGDESLQLTFDDIGGYAAQCRFGDCQHQGEPDCAVLAAIGRGDLPAERLASYRKLQREQAFLERRQNKSAAAAEKKKWKQIHKDQRKFKKPRF